MGLWQRLVRWARVKSPWILHFNSGACNACDIEVLAALCPRFDVERLGMLLKGSPRHADVLVCTGPVTRQVARRLRRIYAQIPAPRFVLAVGTCAASGGVFRGCYNVLGGVDEAIPVDMYVPGCPPRPDAIIHGAAQLLAALARSGESAAGQPYAGTARGAAGGGATAPGGRAPAGDGQPAGDSEGRVAP